MYSALIQNPCLAGAEEPHARERVIRRLHTYLKQEPAPALPSDESRGDSLYGFVRKSAPASEDQLDCYLMRCFSYVETSNMLRFWGSHQKFPVLARIAFMLAVPATSCETERVFSVTGLTYSIRRTRLEPVSVEALVFLKVNTDAAGDLLGVRKKTGAGGSSGSVAGEEVASTAAATVVEVLD